MSNVKKMIESVARGKQVEQALREGGVGYKIPFFKPTHNDDPSAGTKLPKQRLPKMNPALLRTILQDLKRERSDLEDPASLLADTDMTSQTLDPILHHGLSEHLVSLSNLFKGLGFRRTYMALVKALKEHSAELGALEGTSMDPFA